MSRSSYGCIAYKIPHADGMTDQQIIENAQWIVQEMVAILTAHGGELVTLQEVMKKRFSCAARVGEQSTRDAVKGKKPL